MGYAAVILAGGAARRLGGVDKAGLEVGGHVLLRRVLQAVSDAEPRVVVGPPRSLPDGAMTTQEHPPGAGPVAALAAGLSLVPDHVAYVAVLAGDMPFLTRDAIGELMAAVTGDAAVFTDGDHPQYLCAVWRLESLRTRLASLGPPAGTSLKELYATVAFTQVTSAAQPPPWYDCDTEEDLHRAQELADSTSGRLTP